MIDDAGIEDIKREINALAERLVTYDSDTQSDEINTTRQMIYDLFFCVETIFKRTDSKGNDWLLFPLLNNIEVPWETVLITMEENLRKSKKSDEWNYKPNEGDFIETIVKKTLYKVGRGSGLLKGYTQTDEETDRSQDPNDSIDDLETLLALQQEVAYIAEMIINQAWLKAGKENKQHFEGFFTHDRVTEERRENGAYITDEYSAIIFPAMSIALLTFLMEGDFCHMLDLVMNQVREGINLSQSIENVGSCFKMKSPKHYHLQYNKWLKSIERDSMQILGR